MLAKLGSVVVVALGLITAESAAYAATEVEPPSPHFIFDENGVVNSANPAEYVRVGEGLSQLAFKQRFSRYRVRNEGGIECSICASADGPAGKILVEWGEKGAYVASVTSGDTMSRDKFGNRKGDSLAQAVGAKVAICGPEGNPRCDSRAKGLSYSFELIGKNCEMDIPGDRERVSIPDCAVVDGFEVSLVEGTPLAAEAAKLPPAKYIFATCQGGVRSGSPSSIGWGDTDSDACRFLPNERPGREILSICGSSAGCDVEALITNDDARLIKEVYDVRYSKHFRD